MVDDKLNVTLKHLCPENFETATEIQQNFLLNRKFLNELTKQKVIRHVKHCD